MPGFGAQDVGRLERLRSASGELSGAFGDLGTFLPYVVAAVGAGILAPTPVFAGFAAGYVLVAAVYRMPVSVQPMKALGAVIIAGGLTAVETAWAGGIVGAVLLLLAAIPSFERAARAIPQSVVTGLQAGLGLMLGTVAFGLMSHDWVMALASLAVLSLALLLPRGPWVPLVVIGAVLLVPHAGPPMTPASPAGGIDTVHAVLSGVLAQLPLTLLNAVVVAAAVARSLYPDRAARVNERRLAATNGLMNLLLAPLGAMPMCHGAGGIAAHRRFGARGMGAPLIMAASCGAVVAMGPEIVGLLMTIPPAVVGALLIYAAADLILSPRLLDARPDCRPVIAAAALATVFLGALAGLLTGLAAEGMRVYIRRRHRPGSTHSGG
ncbi:MAG: putative sulfate/molybdate transporter [Alphaproteobacteria bacterium]|nr:putative sulfate/molybdate transporter [Alphaproteobacteria bacterium]MCY3753323.1 putative sulfate/molybdate transporter [Alphaproteobacteria bacterium]MYE58137.1 benzoate transporter [Alphaproteobacteria bacterium]